MQEDLVKRHGHPVEMVDILRTARMWYPGVQESLNIQDDDSMIWRPPGSLFS